MSTRTVLDLATGAGTLPGALLRTLVAQRVTAFTTREVAKMALTVLRPHDRVGPGLTTTVRHEGATTVVVLRGEADTSTTTVLSDALSRLIATAGGDVVIDLSEAEFIDTATVRTFAVAVQLFGNRGRKLTFRSPSRLAARVLDLFGLSQSIERRERAVS